MVAPIDYSLPGVQSPGTGFLQAAQVGANVAQVQAQREQMLAQREAAAAKVEEARRVALEAQQRQEAQERARTEFFANPRPTLRDALQFAQSLDKDQIAAFKPYIERLSADEQQSRLRFGLGVLSALETDPAVAANILTERATAEESQGNTTDATFYRSLVDSIRKGDPASAFKVATTLVAPLPGAKEAMEARAAARALPTGAKILSSQEAVKLGLPAEGRYYLDEKGSPKLIPGTEAAPDIKLATQYAALSPDMRKTVDTLRGQVAPRTDVRVTPGLDKQLSPIQAKIDETFAKTYVDWNTGGASNSASRVAQLNAVTKVLESGKPITGPVLGLVPDTVLSFVNPKSVAARQDAELVIQEGLRAVLGAQFTQKEGEAFLARAFNPKLGEKENIRRLRKFSVQLDTARKQTQAMVEYVNKNKTLAGFEGKMPDLGDFYSVLGVEAETPAAAPAAPPTEGAKSTSKSGRPITFRNGQWVYD